MVFSPLYCFSLKETLPFYSKETLNILWCHKILSTYAESKAYLAEKSHVKQVIQNALAVKSRTFKNRARVLFRKLLAARLTFGWCYQIHTAKLPPTLGKSGLAWGALALATSSCENGERPHYLGWFGRRVKTPPRTMTLDQIRFILSLCHHHENGVLKIITD